MPAREVLGHAVGIVGLVEVLEVRLVEHRQDVRRNVLEVRVELRARVRRAGRVVRRGDEDELRPRRDRREHRLEVDPLVDERDANRDGAELQRIDDVARERRPARDGFVARVERRQADVAHDRVRAGADGHLVEADPVPLGELAPKPPRPAVGVAVELERRAGDRLLGGRERPVRALRSTRA